MSERGVGGLAMGSASSDASDNQSLQQPQRTAGFACYSCRRRKVKCDRILPRCQVCAQTGQDCDYPLCARKPGPKIGSLQHHARQYRDRHARETRRRQSSAGICSPSALNSPGNGIPKRRTAPHRISQSRSRGGQDDREASASYSDDDEIQSEPSASRKDEAPPSTARSKRDEWAQRRQNSRLDININDLSFILHPSHEASTPEKEPLPLPDVHGGVRGNSPRGEDFVQQACCALGITPELLWQSVGAYFDSMVAINLFHRPSFGTKIKAVTSPVQLLALLAAMIGYTSRFLRPESDADPAAASAAGEQLGPSEHYEVLARKFIGQALDDCGDDPPTLCILQASIITTHCELTRGVHGRAWRSLGMCVRLAYEMNLHLVDAGSAADTTTKTAGYARGHEYKRRLWRDAEEKRRAWWAVWEMDVFASTIRRMPTAIDWSQMETLLPVDDADWFLDRPAPSCRLDLDPTLRWKVLQDSGNQSHKTWFIVVNSLMKDAQVISSPHGVPFQADGGGKSQPARQQQGDNESAAVSPPRTQQQQRRRAIGRRHLGAPAEGCPDREAREKLEILSNAVQCFVLALPAALRYRSQYLTFEGPDRSGASEQAPGDRPSSRQLHCGVHNIFVMTQLARLMIFRYDLFGNGQRQHTAAACVGTPAQTRHASCSMACSTATGDSLAAERPSSTDTRHATSNGFDGCGMATNPTMAQYFEAADSLLTIASRSCEEHVRYINPFLLSTFWLAAAVQLVRRHIGGPAANPHLIKSRFDVLYLTYKRGVDFWDVRTAMEQNLELLEVQLENRGQQATSDRPGRDDTPWTKQQERRSVSALDRTGTPTDATRSAPEQPRPGGSPSASAVTDTAAPSPSILDYLRFDQPTLRPVLGSMGSTTSVGYVGGVAAAGHVASGAAEATAQRHASGAAVEGEHQLNADLAFPLEDAALPKAAMGVGLLVQESQDWHGFSLLNDIHDLMTGF